MPHMGKGKRSLYSAAAERLFVEKHFPILNAEAYVSATNKSSLLNL
jgi:hypothetical protein